jgi:hypothetical protein
MSQNNVFPIFYLGSIEYYSQLVTKEHVALEKNENFVKQTYRNRCSIYGANGKLDLFIPLAHKRSSRIIKDIVVSQSENWQTLHWRSFQSAYQASPYFEFYEDDLAPLYEKKVKYLTDFNIELHEKIKELGGFNKETVFTSKYQQLDESADFRNKFSAKKDPEFASFKDKEYIQVFSNKFGFIENLSIIDLLFNEGPNSINYLKSLT